MKEKEQEIRKEALQLIYAEEIAKCTMIMKKRFKMIDEKNTGSISVA